MTSCPRCGSPRIVRNAHILELAPPVGGEVAVAVYRDPEARLFRGAVSTPLRAHVCGACGYAELYAEDPGALLQVAAAARGHYGDPAPPPSTRRAPGDPDACLQCGALMPGVDTCPACGWTYAPPPEG